MYGINRGEPKPSEVSLTAKHIGEFMKKLKPSKLKKAKARKHIGTQFEVHPPSQENMTTFRTQLPNGSKKRGRPLKIGILTPHMVGDMVDLNYDRGIVTSPDGTIRYANDEIPMSEEDKMEAKYHFKDTTPETVNPFLSPMSQAKMAVIAYSIIAVLFLIVVGITYFIFYGKS